VLGLHVSLALQAAPFEIHSPPTHASGCAPVQRTAPDEQPQSPSPLQTGVSPEHAVSLCQVPLALHSRGVASSQPRVPGVHSPVHSPSPEQTYVQDVGSAH
jgi:hypothetical protein